MSHAGYISRSGVKDLNMMAEFSDGPTDESHAWSAVHFDFIKHGFAQNIRCMHFGFACVAVWRNAHHITTKDCLSEKMVSNITGGRRYSFYLEGEASLFTGCYVDGGRHMFVTGSKVAGPSVFYDCHATNCHADIGPHHRWATGILYDRVTGGSINVEDRGSAGSGHGWSGAQIVFWNCQSNELYNSASNRARIKVEAAPTTLSWSIGSVGPADAGGAGAGGRSRGRSIWESYGRHVSLESLYLAQLADVVYKSSICEESGMYYCGQQNESGHLLCKLSPCSEPEPEPDYPDCNATVRDFAPVAPPELMTVQNAYGNVSGATPFFAPGDSTCI